ncbi:10363_t:CDS:1, partial [Gigaspora rosea]
MSEQYNVPLSPHISSTQVLSQEDSSTTIELISTDIAETDQVISTDITDITDIAETDQIIVTATKEVPNLVDSITENLFLPPLSPNQPSPISNNSVSVISCSDSYPEGTVHHKKGATESNNPSNQSLKFNNFYSSTLYDPIRLSKPMSLSQNLNFDIIHVTGWDDNYPPRQLLPNDNNCNNNDVI